MSLQYIALNGNQVLLLALSPCDLGFQTNLRRWVVIPLQKKIQKFREVKVTC